MFALQGDLNQLGEQEHKLRQAGFILKQWDVIPYFEDAKDFEKALNFIWFRKIKGWWLYKDEYVKYGICTAEEWREELKKSVARK